MKNITRKILSSASIFIIILAIFTQVNLLTHVAAQSGTPQVAWTSSMVGSQNLTGSNFTCRWITHPSIGGNTIRIHISNLFGSSSETFNAASVAIRTSRAAVSSITPVKFGGQSSVTIPAHGEAISDPVTFAVSAQQDLAVSLYYAGSNPVLTANPSVARTSYCTSQSGSAGDHTNDPADTSFVNSAPVMWSLSAVDVYNTPMTGAIIAFGASITDGVGSTTDGNNSWVDVLSNRLLQFPNPKSIVNEGISGDGACSNGSNGGVDRIGRDATALAGASYVLLSDLGSNSISSGATGDQVISCYQTIINAVHAAGLKIVGATIIPRSFGSTQESYRTQVNNWIRTPGNFDSMVDFDAFVRDPNNPVNILPAYNTGDNIHPNVAGHAATANSIDLSVFGITASGDGNPFNGTPYAIPGKVEAENYNTGGEGVAYHDADPTNQGGQYRTDGVDIEATGDTGGGYNVGWTATGEWLKYTVNVASAGTYNFDFRVASPGTGSSFHLEVDGNNVTGTLTVPNTGGWQTWADVTKTGISLSAGQHVLRWFIDNGGMNFNWFSINASGGATNTPTFVPTINTPTNTPSSSGDGSPFGGTAWAIPGKVEAENYNTGGQNVAYNFPVTGNLGTPYRTDCAQNIESTSDTGGGWDVGWTASGEWMKYTVNVTASGTYSFDFRVASPNTGSTFHMEVDGANVTGTLTVPNTGAWQTWTDVIKSGISLSAGQHILRWVTDAGGMNYNWFSVSAAGGSTNTPTLIPPSNTPTNTLTPSSGDGSPIGGVAWAIPGKVETENFNTGGEGIAYHDADPTNQGGQYRTSEGVDIETTSDTGGGFDVGWTASGEWMKYTVNVSTGGTYNIDFRVASPNTGTTFHLEVDSANVTGTMTVPNTGGWQTWTTITKTGVNLTSGQHVLRWVTDAGGMNDNWMNFSQAGSVTNTPIPQLVVAINAGGTANGSYVADTDFDSGNMFSDTSTAIDTSGDPNPAPPGVYQTVRWNTNFTYTIPGLTAGTTYTVRLHWAELTWQTAGSRKFNVAINGTTVLSAFDVFATGGFKKAVARTFTTTANGSGQIVIAFTNGGADNPFISGIEVLH